VQHLDYGQIPFKCKVSHEYGHFMKNSKKATPSQSFGSGLEEQCGVVHKKFGAEGSNHNVSGPGSSISPPHSGQVNPPKTSGNSSSASKVLQKTLHILS